MKSLSVIFTVLLFAVAIQLSDVLHRSGALPVEGRTVGPLASNSPKGTPSDPAFVNYVAPSIHKFN